LRAEQVGALAAIGLGPAHALAQRLRMHAQVGCDLGDRTLRLEHEPNAAVHQLLWVLPSSWHRRRISSPQDSKSWLRGLRQTRPGSVLVVRYFRKGGGLAMLRMMSKPMAANPAEGHVA